MKMSAGLALICFMAIVGIVHGQNFTTMPVTSVAVPSVFSQGSAVLLTAGNGYFLAVLKDLSSSLLSAFVCSQNNSSWDPLPLLWSGSAVYDTLTSYSILGNGSVVLWTKGTHGGVEVVRPFLFSLGSLSQLEPLSLTVCGGSYLVMFPDQLGDSVIRIICSGPHAVDNPILATLSGRSWTVTAFSWWAPPPSQQQLAFGGVSVSWFSVTGDGVISSVYSIPDLNHVAVREVHLWAVNSSGALLFDRVIVSNLTNAAQQAIPFVMAANNNSFAIAYLDEANATVRFFVANASYISIPPYSGSVLLAHPSSTSIGPNMVLTDTGEVVLSLLDIDTCRFYGVRSQPVQSPILLFSAVLTKQFDLLVVNSTIFVPWVTTNDFYMAAVTCSSGYFGQYLSCQGCPLGTANPLPGQSSVSACVPCGNGSYAASYASSSCTACPPGRFGNETGKSSLLSACYACSEGSFASMNGSTVCHACPEGSYANFTGAIQCIACPAGSFNNVTGATTSSACLLCAPGSMAPDHGAASCSLCGQGSYGPTGGLKTCVLCPAGTSNALNGSVSVDACIACQSGSYSPVNGAASCMPCDAGSFNPQSGSSSVNACIPCFAGTYGARMGLSFCTPCTYGTASNVVGSQSESDCALCAAGTYAMSLGSENCSFCEAGTFNPSRGASVCFPCSQGTAGNVTGASKVADCRVCPPGTYTSRSGSTQCIPCGLGFYASQSGSSSCTPCAAGTYSNVTGASSQALCSLCPAGTFSASVAATSLSTCHQCPLGAYAEVQGSSTCTLCPPGTYSANVGATSAETCIPCQVGTYSPFAGASACFECPPGHHLNTTGASAISQCLPCGKGYYAQFSGSPVCSACPPGSYALDTRASSCVLCPTGTYQPYSGQSSFSACRSCSRGYVSSTVGLPSCSPCSAGMYQDEQGQVTCKACPTGYRARSSALVSKDSCNAPSEQYLLILQTTIAVASALMGASFALLVRVYFQPIRLFYLQRRLKQVTQTISQEFSHIGDAQELSVRNTGSSMRSLNEPLMDLRESGNEREEDVLAALAELRKQIQILRGNLEVRKMVQKSSILARLKGPLAILGLTCSFIALVVGSILLQRATNEDVGE